jgi:hypothetical protein
MREALTFGVGGGLVAIKTLLSRDPCVHANTAIEMIDAILKEHPAAPVQEPVGLIDRLTNPEDHYEFTDPKKANAVLMSLCQEAADALAAPTEQEPVAWMQSDEVHISLWKDDYHTIPLYTAPPAQPAVPLTDEQIDAEFEVFASKFDHESNEWLDMGVDEYFRAGFRAAAPAAQPAVPDAMTSADIQEHIEYVAGWNDCRQAMLEMMK